MEREDCRRLRRKVQVSTLDRYILKEFLKTFLLIVLSLVCLYLVVDFFERIRMFLSNDATASQMVSYFIFNIPMILSQMIPVTFLLSTLLTFGLLSKNSEITAMKANGVSLYRISMPVIVLSFLVCIFAFLLSEFITPYTNQKAKHIKLVEVQKREKMGSFKESQIWYRGQEGIYNFTVFDPEKATLKGIRINFLDRDMNLTRRIDAKEALWNKGKWHFRDLVITTFPEDDFPVLERVSSRIIDLPEKPADFTMVQKDTEEMGFWELRKFIEKVRSEGYDATHYITDLHGKIAFPLVSLILSFLGVAFSLKSERSGGIAQGVGAGIVIGFSYWIVFAFSMSLGHGGTLPPFVAAWSANIVLGAVALFLFSRIRT
ncbi:MAG: LPS export ABC transporter permease LptG [Thermodesulfobacteriota bacterium]|nr:LPS export ABC transporter permease LptG [Thermodesulfobacteriota bacterium]